MDAVAHVPDEVFELPSEPDFVEAGTVKVLALISVRERREAAAALDAMIAARPLHPPNRRLPDTTRRTPGAVEADKFEQKEAYRYVTPEALIARSLLPSLLQSGTRKDYDGGYAHRNER